MESARISQPVPRRRDGIAVVHKMDFIIETEGRIVAVEAKIGRSRGDADVLHLHSLRERLGGDLVDAAQS